MASPPAAGPFLQTAGNWKVSLRASCQQATVDWLSVGKSPDVADPPEASRKISTVKPLINVLPLINVPPCHRTGYDQDICDNMG